MTDDIARELANYAAEFDTEDLDCEVRETAKDRLLDSVACAIGVLEDPSVDRLYRHAVTKTGDSNARLLGSQEGAALEYAAMASAGAIRYLDWNDEYDSLSVSHPSCNIGPILAAADAYEMPGRDVLAATVLAYEVQCRLCDTVTLKADGIDHVTFGAVSTALAVGRLAGLDAEGLADAVNLVLVGGIPLRQSRTGELSSWKGFAFGNAARNAVTAVELVAAGIDAPTRGFEGEYGLSNLLAEPVEVCTDEFGGRSGEFRIMQTNVKPYPACYHVQGAVDCAIELHDAGVDPESIERVTVETFERAVSVTASDDEKWRPRTRNTADHSMPYCVARGLLDGRLGLDAFEEGAFGDPEIVELMSRVEVVERSEFTERHGKASPHVVTVETSDGASSLSVEYPRGHHRRPLSDEEFATKLDAATGDAFQEGSIDEVAAWLDGLEDHDDITELFDLVAVE